MGKKQKQYQGRNRITKKSSNVGFNIFLFILFVFLDVYVVLNYSYVTVNNPNMEITKKLMELSNYLGNAESFKILEMIKNQAVMDTFINTQKYLVIVYIIIGMIIVTKFMEEKQDFKGIEHGSADWADKNDTKRFANSKNTIVLADGLYLDPGDREADNLNELVIGGSGAGKSWRKVKPDIMQMVGSYVVTDPKGELYRDTYKMLKKNGYKIKVLNILQPKFSDGYNPFNYINKEQYQTDVPVLVNCFMKNTSDPNQKGGDPFWEDSMKALLTAIIYYLVLEESENKCFERVFELVRKVSIDEETGEIDESKTELERIFKKIERENPNHPGLQAYEEFKLASGKTAKSILISCAVRLNIWISEDICTMTYNDEMELEKVGTEKTAIFLITPDTDDTFNVLASMFYTQLFKVLFYEADYNNNGKLPYLVSCELDEFANIGEIPNFEKYIATMRSRNVRVAIILQALSQLEKLYKDSWEIILGCCYVTNYLGTTDKKTQKFVSERLGKTTVLVKNKGESKSSKSYSTSDNGNYIARDLMTVDEVNRLSKENSIVLIRGLNPFFCEKFNSKKHPQIKLVGSNFADGIPNNTDIRQVYKDKAILKLEEHRNRVKLKLEKYNNLNDVVEKEFDEEEVKKFFENNSKM